MRWMIAFFLFGNFFLLHAGVEDDLHKKLQKAYNENNSMKFHIDVELFHTETTKKGEVVYQADMIRWGKYSYMAVSGNSMLLCDSEAIAINYKTKYMVYARQTRNKKQSAYSPVEVLKLMDSVKQNIDSVYVINKDSMITTYSIQYKKGLINTMYLTLDNATNLIKSITYYYNGNLAVSENKVIVFYKNYMFTNEDKKVFDITRYITRDKKQIKPSREYADFEFFIQ